MRSSRTRSSNGIAWRRLADEPVCPGKFVERAECVAVIGPQDCNPGVPHLLEEVDGLISLSRGREGHGLVVLAVEREGVARAQELVTGRDGLCEQGFRLGGVTQAQVALPQAILQPGADERVADHIAVDFRGGLIQAVPEDRPQRPALPLFRHRIEILEHRAEDAYSFLNLDQPLLG